MAKKLPVEQSEEPLTSQLGEPKGRFDLSTSVLSQFHFVGNCIQSTGMAGYRKWFDISVSELRLLVVISNHPGSTGARIHKSMGLDLGAISRSLRSMESRGLVVSTAHAKHPSYRCWHVTKAGAELHDKAYRMTEKREKAIVDGFTDAEKFQLLSYLHRLSENVDKLKWIAETGGKVTDS